MIRPSTTVAPKLFSACSCSCFVACPSEVGYLCAANDMGNRTTPSYVAFTDTERLIGDAAKSQVPRFAQTVPVTSCCRQHFMNVLSHRLCRHRSP